MRETQNGNEGERQCVTLHFAVHLRRLKPLSWRGARRIVYCCVEENIWTQKPEPAERFDTARDNLIALSHRIHAHPELGFEEGEGGDLAGRNIGGRRVRG